LNSVRGRCQTQRGDQPVPTLSGGKHLVEARFLDRFEDILPFSGKFAWVLRLRPLLRRATGRVTLHYVKFRHSAWNLSSWQSASSSRQAGNIRASALFNRRVHLHGPCASFASHACRVNHPCRPRLWLRRAFPPSKIVRREPLFNYLPSHGRFSLTEEHQLVFGLARRTWNLEP